MKRYISNQEKLPKYYYSLYGGIYVDRNDDSVVKFNWDVDKPDDVLMLCRSTSGQFDNRGVRCIYGYEFNPSADRTDKDDVRKYLKNLGPSNGLFDENVDHFAENGILSIENYCSFDFFDAIVSIESTSSSPSLIGAMDQFFFEYCTCRDLEFKLLKQTYEHVEFDAEKAAAAMRAAGRSESAIRRSIAHTLDKFDQLKQSGELFQMERFIPRSIREGFTNFLKFKSEEEQRLYSRLQGANLLVYDDFYTSGSTINEIIRYLHSINDKNTLTVFILVKQ